MALSRSICSIFIFLCFAELLDCLSKVERDQDPAPEREAGETNKSKTATREENPRPRTKSEKRPAHKTKKRFREILHLRLRPAKAIRVPLLAGGPPPLRQTRRGRHLPPPPWPRQQLWRLLRLLPLLLPPRLPRRLPSLRPPSLRRQLRDPAPPWQSWPTW